jgi:hypothetical protein
MVGFSTLEFRSFVFRFWRIVYVCFCVARRIPVNKIPSDLSSDDVQGIVPGRLDYIIGDANNHLYNSSLFLLVL